MCSVGKGTPIDMGTTRAEMGIQIVNHSRSSVLRRWLVGGGAAVLLAGALMVEIPVLSNNPASATTAIPGSESAVAGVQGTGASGCSQMTKLISARTVPVPEFGRDSVRHLESTVLTFSSEGNIITERTPPPDWTPASATNSELSYFGIPVKPRSGPGKAAWLATDSGRSLLGIHGCTSVRCASERLCRWLYRNMFGELVWRCLD